MGFAQENGYTPSSFNTLMNIVMAGVNAQFNTSYTADNFVGSNHYKFFYGLVQELQKNDVKTSEIFQKLQDYFATTNERISRPVNTNPGLIEKLESEGYIASVKPMVEEDAGKIHICVDVDDGENAEGEIEITSYANLVSGTPDAITVGATAFTAQAGAATPGTATFQAATSNEATATSLAAQINAHAVAGDLVEAVADGAVITLTAKHGGEAGNSIALSYTNNDANVGATVSDANLTGGVDNEDYEDIRLEICTIIKNSTAAGNVTIGGESETIVLSNGQSFDFKYALPNRYETWLRLTIPTSENNQVVIQSPEDIKAVLLANVAARYRLGKNFEPQRYYGMIDAPWAASVLLEYSNDWDPVGETGTWSSTVYDADFDEKFEISLDRILVVQT